MSTGLARAARALGLACAVATLAACAVPPQEVPVSAALFTAAREVLPVPTPGRVVLQVPPQVLASVAPAGHAAGPSSAVLQLPIGRLVAEAATLALGDALRDGVAGSEPKPAPVTPPAATLVIDSVQFEHKVQLLWLLPVPVLGVIGDTEVGIRVSFGSSLIDADGQTVWTRRHDSGRVVWHRPRGSHETPSEGVIRLAHETTLRLAQQAAREIAEWLQAERLKPRAL